MATLCMGCMQVKQSSPRCEHCGYDERSKNNTHQLPVGTIVGRQYILGKVLGQGGFGITYVGWDNIMQQRVAVKEYFPSGYAGRGTHSLTVTSYDGAGKQDFESNKRRFLREADALAKLQNVPQIVRVLRHFEENGTAYIAMEYVEGMDLRKYLKQHRGPLSMEETLTILGPVIQALAQVHKAELIHRDISPDNIMVLPDGSTKLLDFGAARYVQNANALQDRNTSTQAILKHGFAPPEQYRSHGALGPWTDVYAMCATIYYCLTGKLLPEAMSRTMDDEKIDWSPLRSLPRRQRAALEKGLEIQPKDRFASMEELWLQLKPAEPKPEPRKHKKPESKKSNKPLLITAVAAAAVVATMISINFLPKDSQELPQGSQQMQVPEIAAAPAPDNLMPSSEGEAAAPDETEIAPHATDDSNMPTHSNDILTFSYEENETGITIIGYEGPLPAELILPDKIDGKTVTAIGYPAFYECSTLISVKIPDSVTSIGNSAFSKCSGLKSVYIPASVTEIGNLAFNECTSLTDVTIPDSVTALGHSIFKKCSSLKTITIPGSVSKIDGSTFYGCTNLRSVTILDGVTEIGGCAFYKCDSLREIALPKTLTSIGSEAFSWCESLTEISLPDGLTYIGEKAFLVCSKLKRIVIPYGVTAIEDETFSDCYDLTEIVIPNSVTSIGDDAFRVCFDLENIVIPDSVTSIGYGCFTNCDKLTQLVIPNSVTSMESFAIHSCYALQTITVSNSLTSCGGAAIDNCTALKTVIYAPGTTTIKQIFQGCKNITSVTIPNTVTTIEKGSFNDCINLVNISIPESVSLIEKGAFSECSQMTNVSVPKHCTVEAGAFPSTCTIHYY